METTNSSPPFISDILNKCVARVGKKQLWRIAALLRSQEHCNIDDLRVNLRRLGVFFEDVLYEHMQVRYFGYDSSTTAISSKAGQMDETSGVVFPLMTLTSAFILDLLNCLSPRRRHIINLAMQSIGPTKPELLHAKSPEGLLVEIPLEHVIEAYDVFRHPDVVNNVQNVDKVRQRFFDALDFAGHSTTITLEQLMLYYLGISVTTPQDTDFELLCIRSFSLDRPRMNFEEQLERIQGSSKLVNYSRLTGQSKRANHPLYCTTNSDYGKKINDPIAAEKAPYFGRSQKFSSSLPPHKGGATSMNM